MQTIAGQYAVLGRGRVLLQKQSKRWLPERGKIADDAARPVPPCAAVRRAHRVRRLRALRAWRVGRSLRLVPGGAGDGRRTVRYAGQPAPRAVFHNLTTASPDTAKVTPHGHP